MVGMDDFNSTRFASPRPTAVAGVPQRLLQDACSTMILLYSHDVILVTFVGGSCRFNHKQRTT